MEVLPETRLPKEDGKQLALHPPRKLGDLFFAPKEVGARLLGEGGKAEPRIALVDGSGASSRAGSRMHSLAAARSLLARLHEVAQALREVCPHLAARQMREMQRLEFVRAPAPAAVSVPSMVTGRMKSAPSAMLRTRSIA